MATYKCKVRIVEVYEKIVEVECDYSDNDEHAPENQVYYSTDKEYTLAGVRDDFKLIDRDIQSI